MQVILIADVDHLGGKNELVTVKNGYARNFLIPQKKAVEASHSNRKQLEETIKAAVKKEALLLEKIHQVLAVLKESPVKIVAKTGTSGKIFGSVTSLQIARAIREQKGYEIDRRRIVLSEEIKELGSYKATIDFSKNNVVEIDFEVISE